MHKLQENTVFQRRKHSRIGKNFVDWSLVLPKDATPSNFVEKTFVNSNKTLKFTKVFSLESFLL